MNVRWMKSLPAFVGLPQRDQLTLLEEGWRELFVLGACQFQMPLDAHALLTHSGNYLTEQSRQLYEPITINASIKHHKNQTLHWPFVTYSIKG